MLDQTQNQSGTLQKGTETKDKSEPKDQHSKAARLRTLNEERDAVHKAWQRTRNIYGYSQQKPKPKRDTKKEREEDEKKYLARYKEPKAKPKKSSNLKYADDLGGIKLRKHFAPKRREYLAKRKEYEVKYVKRYMKKLESEPKQSSSNKLDHDLISGRLNLREIVDKKRKELQTERKEYEEKYISKHKEPKVSQKKSSNLKHDDDLGRLSFQKHFATKRREIQVKRDDYEKEYLARYNKQQKAKQRKKNN